jgi:hypothetical protein
MDRLLKIFFKEEGNSYNDLIVEINRCGFKKELDSYYLGLDNSYNTNLDGIKRIKLVLVSLLEYWSQSIQKLEVNEVCYLPIDFSDEYTGCFKIEKFQTFLMLSYGYSSIEGWSIVPSDPGDYSIKVSDFEKDEDFLKLKVTEEELLNSLGENINENKV